MPIRFIQRTASSNDDAASATSATLGGSDDPDAGASDTDASDADTTDATATAPDATTSSGGGATRRLLRASAASDPGDVGAASDSGDAGASGTSDGSDVAASGGDQAGGGTDDVGVAASSGDAADSSAGEGDAGVALATPAPTPASEFTVYDLEQAKIAAHEAAWVSPICGYDQYYDNHFALQQYQVPVDTFTDALSALDNKWHCNRVGFGTIDVYAVEPSGDAIQLDGYLTDEGTSGLEITGCFNATNVLFHLCSQGKCHHKTEIAGYGAPSFMEHGR